jgi:hypothetical protein
MRAWIVSPSLGAALIALVISSVEASEMTRRGDTVSSPVGAGGALPAQAVSPAAVSRHVIATPRALRPSPRFCSIQAIDALWVCQ